MIPVARRAAALGAAAVRGPPRPRRGGWPPPAVSAVIRRLGPATVAREGVVGGARRAARAGRAARPRPRRLPRRRAQGDRRLRAGQLDPSDAPKEHERCGSNLIAPLLVLSPSGQLAVERLFEPPGPGAARRRRGRRASPGPSSSSPTRSAARTRRWAARSTRSATRSSASSRPASRRRSSSRSGPPRSTRSCGPSSPPPATIRRTSQVPRKSGCRYLFITDLQGRANARMTTLAILGIDWYEFQNYAQLWLPLIFMGVLVFLVWRTLRLMPRTKPQQITPRSASSVTWGDIAGVDETKDELREVVEFLRRPEAVQAPRRDGARRASCCTARRAPARPCSPRRSPTSPAPTSSASRPRRSSRCSRASARRGSGACSSRRARTPRRSSSSTSSTPSAPTAARTSRASATRR